MKLKPSFQFRLLLWPLLSLLFVILMAPSKAAEPDFLPPEQAFQFSSKQISPNKIEVSFRIADGYYMYRDRFKFKTVGATLGEVILPQGIIKFDETFQKDMETFRNLFTLQVPLIAVDTTQPSFTLIVQSQGCSDEGLCYVPMESKQVFSTSDFLIGATDPVKSGGSDDADRLVSSLHGENLLAIMPLFMLMGLGLAFTPCVLPMVPILSSIVVGEGVGVKKSRGLLLSVSYSLGMAVVYTALGVAAGLLGEGLAAFLQKPWILGVFGLVLVGLALSMFNVYHLQIPAAWQSKLSHLSHRQGSGKVLGVFVMGAISALIVGPCVAAPLASALLYIGQTKNVVIGGSALFSMAVGMSVPLILVGVSAGSLLPRVGAWMESVKQLFGVLMLALALWLVSPVLPSWLIVLGCAGLLIAYGVFLFRHRAAFIKIVAIALCIGGLVELVGVVTGGRDVLDPLAHLSNAPQKKHLSFTPIKSIAELDQTLKIAKVQGKPVMLDFYADWCVACKEMEKFTFIDPDVQAQLANMVLLQVDVTAHNDDDRALLKHFNLYGPPGIIFFGLDSKESGRVIGFEKPERFLKSLSSLSSSQPIKQ